jgi:hypothetical protein
MGKSNDVEKEGTNSLSASGKLRIEMEVRRLILYFDDNYGGKGVEYFLSEFSKVTGELASEKESPDAKE